MTRSNKLTPPFAWLLVLALPLLLNACGKVEPQASQQPTSPPETKPFSNYTETGDMPALSERGTLRVLVHHSDDEPLPRNDYPIGIHREWLKRFAQEQGLEPIEIAVDDFDQLIPALEEGRGDVIAANLTVLQSRKKKVRFTVPLDHTRQYLVSSKTGSIENKSELAGKTIHVKPGTSHEETALALQEQYEGLTVAHLPGNMVNEAVLDEISQNNISYTIDDENYLSAAARYRSDFDMLFPVSVEQSVAWAVRADASELQASLNRFITHEKLIAPDDFASHGDLDAINKRRTLRVAMRNTMASYFLWRGELYGFEYELARRFADKHKLRLQIVVAEDYTQLMTLLREGKADIAAAYLTPNPWRNTINIAFSRPYHYASEILVSRADDPIESVDQLAGRKIFVRQSSSYWHTLESLLSKGKNIVMEAVDETLDTEQIIDMVARQEFDLTVADNHLLDLELSWRDDIIGNFSLTDPQPQSWAVRAENTQLLNAINKFFGKEYKGEFYNIVYKRYFDAEEDIVQWAEYRDAQKDHHHISPYDDLIREYAERYEFDWRLLAAQIYQESRFNPKARSWSGAKGLMQVMPRTARELGFDNLKDPETGLHAGVKYLDWVRDRFEQDLAVADRMWFTLAAYNAGAGHVRDARRLARQLGKDPDIWFDNVEQAMLLLSKPQYARKARYGYVRGAEPVQYVRNIRDLYLAYSQL